MASEAYSYTYSDLEENREEKNSEVEMHMELRKEAYDRYMDMLLVRAYECLPQNEDQQTDEEDE